MVFSYPEKKFITHRKRHRLPTHYLANLRISTAEKSKSTTTHPDHHHHNHNRNDPQTSYKPVAPLFKKKFQNRSSKHSGITSQTPAGGPSRGVRKTPRGFAPYRPVRMCEFRSKRRARPARADRPTLLVPSWAALPRESLRRFGIWVSGFFILECCVFGDSCRLCAG